MGNNCQDWTLSFIELEVGSWYCYVYIPNILNLLRFHYTKIYGMNIFLSLICALETILENLRKNSHTHIVLLILVVVMGNKHLTEIFIFSFQICLVGSVVFHNNSRLKTIVELFFKVKGLSKRNMMACSPFLSR